MKSGIRPSFASEASRLDNLPLDLTIHFSVSYDHISNRRPLVFRPYPLRLSSGASWRPRYPPH